MSLRARSATAVIAALALLGLLVAPPATAQVSPTATTVTVSAAKPLYGEPVSVSVTVAGAQPGSLVLRVSSLSGTTFDQTFPVDALHPTVALTLPLLPYGTNTVEASYAATDTTVTDASSKDLVLVRVQRETTTISTSVPSVKQGRRLVVTATVVSTHGQPVVGPVHLYLVKDGAVILESVFKNLVDGRVRFNLGKRPPDRYLVVTRYAGMLPFKVSNTLEQHVRVKRS